MNTRLVYLLICLIATTSLFAKRNKAPYKPNRIASQYCDLKKNLNVAIVNVKNKSSFNLTGKAANRKKYSFMNHFNEWGGDFKIPDDKKHYGSSEHKRVFISVGDARFATSECKLDEVKAGSEVSSKELKCINEVINDKIKVYVKISSPAESGWQRNSIQRLKEVETYNKKAKGSGQNLISYKTLRYPETRLLLEDIVYIAIENALVGSGQFTVADRNDLADAYEEIKNSQNGLINEQGQKEIGKMIGADLLAIANITSYTENRVGKDKSKVTMSAEVKLLDVESGVIFKSFTIEKDHTIDSIKKYTDARREMLQKWSVELTSFFDESLKDFPFERKVTISRRGTISMQAGMVDGVENDMFFNLSVFDCYEDDNGEEVCEEEDIGLIKVVDNNRGRDTKAGSESKCEAVDFNEKLEQYNQDDMPYVYLARTPRDITDKMRCK